MVQSVPNVAASHILENINDILKVKVHIRVNDIHELKLKN